ncbi:MAG TPA: sugar phosphate nucleotidyltransferase [Thermoanaerobaculia bacterium]|nr:sugar phosphate nucleotidyltransferase [Thermoanaerobaculia bacterium]
MSTVRRAILPAAGRGMRMRPFSLVVPKELAPVGSRPAIHFVLDEAAGAGIEEVIVVVAPDKPLLRHYLELAQAEGAWPGLRLCFTTQEEPTGLADAIAICAHLTGNDPFALLLPDNLPLAPEYRLDVLLELWAERGRHVVGVLEIDSAWSGLYGNSGRIDHRTIAPGVLAIDRLHDKEPGRLHIPAGARVVRACGRYVFGSEVFARIEASRAGAGETSEVPAVQLLAREGALLGALLPSPLFDVGHPQGLLAASAFLAGRPVDA